MEYDAVCVCVCVKGNERNTDGGGATKVIVRKRKKLRDFERQIVEREQTHYVRLSERREKKDFFLFLPHPLILLFHFFSKPG